MLNCFQGTSSLLLSWHSWHSCCWQASWRSSFAPEGIPLTVSAYKHVTSSDMLKLCSLVNEGISRTFKDQLMCRGTIRRAACRRSSVHHTAASRLSVSRLSASLPLWCTSIILFMFFCFSVCCQEVTEYRTC